MAFTQELIFTVVPNGIVQFATEGAPQPYLNFSLVVSPRLKATVPSTTLVNYPDWATGGPNAHARPWPDTVAALFSSMRLHVLGLPGSPYSLVYPNPPLFPDDLRFPTVFPSTTPVVPYDYQGFDGRKIRSAPVAQAAARIQAMYGRFGFESPTTFPKARDIVDVTAFGPMGFQQTNRPGSIGGDEFGIPGSGQDRKNKLTDAIEAELAANLAVDPAHLLGMATSKGLANKGGVASLVFLQHLQFLNRGLPKTSARTGSPAPPDWDFHKMVSGLGSLPTLLRVLGIVVDFKAGPLSQAAVDQFAGGIDVQVSFSVNTTVNPDHPESTFLLPTNGIFPITMSHLAPGVFKARPQNAATSDHVARMLKIGNDNLFSVIRVDHDTAVLKAVQFANNVTRSRKGSQKQTPFTPDNYALPSLRTGGFAIARTARAVQMVNTLKRQTDDLQGGGSAPVLYEDDLVRGYRFDVFDVDDRKWRSLMWRHGTVTVNGSDPLEVLEEDTVVPAPTQQEADPDHPKNDLYLQETLTRWDGWSLAVPRIGKQFNNSGTSDPTDSGSSGFSVVTEWHVPGEIADGTDETKAGNADRLPRLRFGRQYQFRARVADLAGNALPVKAAPSDGIAVSSRYHHLRFEPLPAPRAVIPKSELRQDLEILRAGDTEEVVVIRSESATVDVKDADMDNGVSMRLLLPGRTSVSMAEQHSAFDLLGTIGQPMDKSVFADIAKRDATPMWDGASLLDGSTLPPPAPSGIPDVKKNTTDNPFLYPNLLRVNYLPDVASPGAVIRNLPLNAFKRTTAELPFDPAKNGWPTFQAARVRLTRATTNDWTVTPVPNKTATDREAQLNLMLAKGYEFTTLVNSGITADTLDLMAVWEWIFLYAQAHNKAIAPVRAHVLAGEHWMFTPWRRVRFVHAVRTPLLNPVLLLRPNKTTIGQTYALFHGTQTNPSPGTIRFSRRSTAKVDVQASWAMQIDDGVTLTPAPDLAQDFQAHAFGIEPARVGFGYVPGPKESITTTVDAQNINLKHEFHDTKYRLVTYKATATSYYVEFFRESKNLAFAGDPISALKTGVQPGVAFEGTTVRLTLHWGPDDARQSKLLTPAPPNTDPGVQPPLPGDYLVTEDPTLNGPNPHLATHGRIQLLANFTAPAGFGTNPVVEFSYVGPTIHTFSNESADRTKNLIVPNSARPKAPDVLYAIPIYKRTPGRGSITRTGGGLRVYLNRPWWSSGDEERLGVVCWHPKPTDGTLPPDSLAPYVTQWGFDPIFKSTGVPDQPRPTCFPMATASRSDGVLTMDETTFKVDVAGHNVGWDAERRLWYCDIQVTDANGKELTSYTPFIKFALARYQPFSIPDAHLSRIVQVDYAQLAPNRHLTVTGTGSTRKVVVTGRAARATANHAAANKIVVLIEQKDVRITDDALAWDPATGPRGFKNTITMSAAASGSSDFVTWTANITLPAGNTKPLRLAFEEYERIAGSFGGGRLAYTETIAL